MIHPINLKIRELIEERKITQREIAEQLGITQGGFNQKLKSKIPFTIDDIVTISHCIEVSAEEILDPILEYSKRGDPYVKTIDFVKFKEQHESSMGKIVMILEKIEKSLGR